MTDHSQDKLEELLRQREEHLGKALSIAHGKPLHITHGSMQYLYASDGTRYLDLVNNVSHVGHSNPRVTEACAKQMGLLNTNTRYVYDGLTKYLGRIADTLPEPLSVGFLVNSGSEANELAVRIARAHTGAHDMVVVEGAYHGHTGMLIDLSPYKFRGNGGKGEPEPWVHVVPIPDTYRGGDRDYAAELGEIVSDAGPIAGFLVESMLSCAGQVPLPHGFLTKSFGHVRAAGGLCIADEVQIGFGRMGEHFWGFETQAIVPDIITLGKSIGNGHPLSVVVTTKEIADRFNNGMEYFNSFGGNPVSCAVGHAVLKVIEEENLQFNALEVGKYLLSMLVELKQNHAIIGDVRGNGLFLGIELIKDQKTLEPAAIEADLLVNEMKEKGILLSTDGPDHNVIKIKPPMVFNRENALYLIEKLNKILSSYGSNLR